MSAQAEQPPAKKQKCSEPSERIAKRIQSAMKVVQRLVTKDHASSVTCVDEATRASKYHRVNSSTSRTTQGDVTTSTAGDARAEVETEARGNAAMPSKTYMCKLCKRTRAVKFFDTVAVCTLRESDELEELSCVDCKVYEDFAAEENYCIGCKKKKPFDAFLGCT